MGQEHSHSRRQQISQCNVVNGGTDKLCYLLFPPKDKEAAEQALVEAYRRRLHLFTQREAKFREDVGPLPVIQYSKRIIANLDFIKRLSTPGETNTEAKSDTKLDNQATSQSPGSSLSSVSQATTQSTSENSVRKRSRDKNKLQEDAEQAMDTSSVSTTESTVTETIKHTNGRPRIWCNPTPSETGCRTGSGKSIRPYFHY
jgi:hypothetical protein